MLKAITKVFKSGQGNVSAIPSLMRDYGNIQRGDQLEWNLDTETNEIKIIVIKPDKASSD